jgi:outer membrane protein assembly factor BamC
METEWAENRAGIPLGGAARLCWRARSAPSTTPAPATSTACAWSAQNGATEIFISHRGAVERGGADGQASRWFIADPDPQLEAQMLNRLLVFLTTGESPETAATRAEEADFERTGQVDLWNATAAWSSSLRGEPDALWRRLGLALDRTG